MNVHSAVSERYSKGAQEVQPALCCPVDYDAALLELLPREIIEKDYGCGDPSRHIREGDVVLDLGSGGGKICYMAAQLVGDRGAVIGVDMNDDMLALARKYEREMAEKLGGRRVRFLKGYIQDLALDVEAMERYLSEAPVRSATDYQRLLDWQSGQRAANPLVAGDSVDLVTSNCVLNLVDDHDKARMIREIRRVLKPGGRVAISDIVADETVPQELKSDPELWSGCISGAFEETTLIRTFIDAGFLAVRLDKWDARPWRVVDGIEFRSVTLTAVKGEDRPCLDHGHAVIYRGPFAEVHDDEGHVYPRGERMAVCERTFRLLTEGPYREDFIGLTPATVQEPVPWCAPSGTRRPVSGTRGPEHLVNGRSDGCC